MIHSDDDGLVLPPRVAQTQIVLIPIIKKNDDEKALKDKVHEIAAQLKSAGLRVAVDDRDNHNPGFKFNHWELKGTPLRMELGSKDFEKQEVKCCVRHSRAKFQKKWDELVDQMPALMDTIHHEMFEKARQAREDHLNHVSNWGEFMESLNKKNICLAPWCNTVKCEEAVKDLSKEESLAAMEAANADEVVLTGSAKTLCIPFEMGKQDFSEEDTTKCFKCGEKARVTALWGRSY